MFFTTKYHRKHLSELTGLEFDALSSPKSCIKLKLGSANSRLCIHVRTHALTHTYNHNAGGYFQLGTITLEYVEGVRRRDSVSVASAQ